MAPQTAYGSLRPTTAGYICWEGRRRGLGDAYVRGISHALDALDAEVVVQMDADFSHDPSDAKRLLARVAAGADAAIGSRYVSGGAVDKEWSLGRRWLSRGGNYLARRIAGLVSVQDCTSGFKAISARALKAAKVSEVRVQGYAFQVALLHRLIESGANIVEQPIYFRDRERGQTKLGVRDLIEFFYSVWWLRVAGYRTFLKFSLVGLSGVLVNLGSFQLALGLGIHKYLASPIAIELSIVSNFLLNNYWTFADRAMTGRRRIRGLKYNLVSLTTLALSYATFVLLSMLFPEAAPVVLQGLRDHSRHHLQLPAQFLLDVSCRGTGVNCGRFQVWGGRADDAGLVWPRDSTSSLHPSNGVQLTVGALLRAPLLV